MRRKILFTLITLLCFAFLTPSIDTKAETFVSINETNFPDKIFRNYVLENVDTVKDGKLSESEISNITKIYVNNAGIGNLKGIEYFTALKTLDCSNNYLTSIDLSRNTALEYLRCGFNQITSLDLSKNTALTTLECYSNQLTSLDLSKTLIWLNCEENNLTSLDLSKNTALMELSCQANQLTSLDLSKNTKLTSLSCSENQLTILNVSKNTKLTHLECDDNQLTSLNTNAVTALTYLCCSDNRLTSLDLSKNTALIDLNCAGNKLTSLDLSKNTLLEYIYCENNQLTSLDISNCIHLVEVYELGNIFDEVGYCCYTYGDEPRIGFDKTTTFITSTSSNKDTSATKVKLNKKKKTIYVGNTYKLKLKGAKSGSKITWKSSDESIATVNSSGKVTAVKKGKVTITATYKNKNYKSVITVKKKKTSSNKNFAK